MSNCKCKSINCNSDGYCDVVTQNSQRESQFFFSSVPYNVMDSMCGGCSISVSNTGTGTCDTSEPWYDYKRAHNRSFSQRRHFFHPHSKKYFGKNDDFEEPVYSCNDQRCQNLNLSCRLLPNRTKVYTHNKNNMYVVPEIFEYVIPNCNTIHGVPLHLLQMEGTLLWIYNALPNKTYSFQFDDKIFKKTANQNGILFLLDKSEFPLNNFSSVSVDCNDTNPHVTNTFLSSQPFTYTQYNGPYLTEEQYISKLLKLHEKSKYIMCAVTNMKNNINVIYENNTHLLL